LLVADVARGDGADFSVYHIINITDMEVVAEYKGKPNIDDFSTILYTAGHEYGNCLLVVENNNIGYSVLEKLIDLDYPNLYYSVKGTHEYLDQVQAIGNNSAIAGFTTSMKTRPLIIAKLEEFVRNNILKIQSGRLLNELKTFIWRNGKPQAMKGYNDDLVMAMAIACWVRDTAIIANKRNEEYQRAMLDSMVYTNTKFNTQMKGQRGYNSRQSVWDQKKDPLTKHKKNMDEFPWIYKG